MSFWENGRQFLYSTFTSPANSKYHGLLNQGATCYLNSVLQVLFMTRDFREAVERCENPDTEYLDRQLKDLFDDLKGRTAKTSEITKKLGINNVYEQRDAAEYYEKILRLTSPEASQIFHGELTHKTICSKCQTEKNADALIWHLPLALMDSYSEDYRVVDGIKEYFRDSHFSGLDQMYCDECDVKVDVTIKCEVKHHPEVLMLLLKRFEFDYCYMTYVKNNRSVDVPHTLQIPENQTYELYAVVDHFGDLRSGHYTATIKCQDDNDERWYNFNDNSVNLCGYQPFQVDNTEKSHTAYLLFYRKQRSHAADTCTEDIRNVSTNGGFISATSDNYDQSQDAEETGEKEEIEAPVDVGNDTAEVASVNRNEETGIKDKDVSDRHQIPDPLNKPDELSNTETRVTDVKTDDGQTGGDEQSKELLTESLNRKSEHQVNEGLDDVRHIKVKNHDDPEHVYKDKQGDEKMKTDFKVNTEEKSKDEQQGEKKTDVNGGKRGNDEHAQKSTVKSDCDECGEGQHYRRFNNDKLEYVGVEHTKNEEIIKLQIKKDMKYLDDGSIGVKQNKPNDNQRCKREISDTSRHSLEKHGEKKRDGKINDKHVQTRGASDRYRGGGVEGQDDVRQNRSQEELWQGNRHKDVGIKTQAEGEEIKQINAHIKNGQDAFLEPEGLAAGRGFRENQGEGSEQPDALSISPSEKGDMMGSKDQSMQHKVKRNDSDIQSSNKKNQMRTDAVEETSHGSKKNQKEISERKSDPKTDTLTKGVNSLNLNESLLPEPKKNRSKGKRKMSEENEKISTIHSKMQKVSDAQVKTAGIKHASKKDVGIKTQADGEEMKKINAHIKNRQDAFPEPEGLAAGRGFRENQGEGSEQPDALSKSLSEKGDMMGSKGQSMQHKVKRNDSDIQSSNKKNKMRTVAVEETSHGSKKNQKEISERKSDPKTDTLTKGVNSLNLNESLLPEPKKNRGMRNRKMSEENETISTNYSNDKKMHKVSDAQVEAAGIKLSSKKGGEKKRKWWHFKNPLNKQNRRKEEKKQKKTPGCSCILKKKEYQMSESD